MTYILNPNIALRGWRLVPRAYYSYGHGGANGLTEEEFEILKKCDGETGLPASPLLDNLISQKLCRLANVGDKLDDWQRYKFCDNRYFPSVNWAVTGKCNFNCRHCFNAADNSRNMSEFTWGHCLDFIRQLDECGVQNVALTGGEPMIHPNFMDICCEFEHRGMRIEELTTNGSFITRKMLEEFSVFREKPLFKLSFDGSGHHDWFRDKQGAENEVIEKIKLLREFNFRVRIQTNVHRGNAETILPTAKLMDSLGVEQIRIIRTTEAPRWEEKGKGLCLSVTEYYDFALDFVKKYLSENLMIAADIWQVIQILPKSRSYHHRPVEGGMRKYRDSFPVCRGARGQIAVTPEGDILPCNQMSGWFKKHGIRMGNVHETPLKELLSGGDYLDSVCYTVGELQKENPKCQTCPHWKLCLGGCRATGIIFGGGYKNYDPIKCVYFDSYLEKFAALFNENNENSENWRCVDDI